MNNKKTALLIVLLLIVDQVVKLLIKCNMTLGESIHVFGDWFQIYFIENPGAAYGMQLGGTWGKLILSLFRIAASGVIGWYIWSLIKKSAPTGVIVAFAMILAGALGNIIDCTIYGVLFSESTYTTVATFLPEGGGYAPLLHGKVVDMLYFPLFTIENMPSWLDWMAAPDGSWTFFSPVFNIADSYITCAVAYLILFQHKYFN
jgi:signal peptidase II